MHRTRDIVSACFSLSLLVLASARPAVADDVATASLMTIATDDAEYFDAVGSFFTIDDDGVVVPVPKTINGATELPIDGANWDIWLSHEVLNWMLVFGGPGADDAKICIRGRHNVAPHAGEPVPNELPRKCGPVFGEDLGFGPPGWVRVVGWHQAHGQHWDHYAVRTEWDAVEDPGGTAHRIGSEITRVQAGHTLKPDDSFRWKYSMATVALDGSSVSYDAVSGVLSFSGGPIGILDSDGGRTGTIDPLYAGDPVLNAPISVTPIQFQGIDPDGRYRFSGGTLSLVDPSGNFGLQGTFSEYLIDDTSQDEPLTSFGLLEEIEVFGVNALPPFLEDFVDVNVFRDGVDPIQSSWVPGVDFAFVTSTNLVDLTAGFTTSAFDVPATIYCTGNVVALPEPEQGVSLLAGCLGLVALAKRRAALLEKRK